jgi:hypothetical protein
VQKKNHRGINKFMKTSSTILNVAFRKKNFRFGQYGHSSADVATVQKYQHMKSRNIKDGIWDIGLSERRFHRISRESNTRLGKANNNGVDWNLPNRINPFR